MGGRRADAIMVGAAVLLAAGCGTTPAPAGSGTGSTSPGTTNTSPAPGEAQLKLTSVDLASGAFPRDLTCDGMGRPPAFRVAGLPATTRSVALEMLDPDAPSGNFTHWLFFADGSFAAEIALPPPGVHQGRNDADGTGYKGPCPPSGTHHYRLVVFALAAPLGGAGLGDGFSRGQLDSAITATGVLGRGELAATYRRG